MSAMARKLASSVARGLSSTGSRPIAAASSRNAAIYRSVYSRSGTPASSDARIVLSSTSVKFMT